MGGIPSGNENRGMWKLSSGVQGDAVKTSKVCSSLENWILCGNKGTGVGFMGGLEPDAMTMEGIGNLFCYNLI